MKVDDKQFLNITSPEISYILGILWADGYIFKNSIFLWLKKTDSKSIENIFNKTGNWNIYYRKLKDRKEQMCFNTYNKFIFNFLVKNDYKNKSRLSPNKILSEIPNNLKQYFFRGYFDGDGTIYSTKKQSVLNITSTYEQDWTDISKFMDKLHIKYSISKIRYTNKLNILNSASRIVIQNINGIVKFCDYIYKDFIGDNIGLKRKYDIYLIIKDKQIRIDKKRIYKSKIYCTHCGSSHFNLRGKYKYGERCSCKNCNRGFTHKIKINKK